MTVSVNRAEFHVKVLEKRMPFHFGNVEVSEDPQLFLRLLTEIDGSTQPGIATAGLVPSWFYKDSGMSLEAGLRNMIEVFRAAARFASQLEHAETPFEFWHALYRRQRDWAAETDHPPLLWSYGVSLVEQALIDAFCRATGLSFTEAVRGNHLGIELGAVYDELAGAQPDDLLPQQPVRYTAVRHTVGLTDPLTDEDLSADERLDDGLPQTLTDYIRVDGIDHFKIKLSANLERDMDRLSRLAELLEDHSVEQYRCTVDANEGYDSAGSFKRQWEALADNPTVARLLNHVVYVEQPLARSDAFSDDTAGVLNSWPDAPPVIIDESDDLIDRAGQALDYGYSGTSHKNCKGVFKGIVNACLMAYRNQQEPEESYVISAEDLTTTGPIELLQDLAVVASIGADHVERNGHHYFRGLSAFSQAIQGAVLEHHSDLYRRHEDGFATLNISGGRIDLNSVIDAPFGVEPLLDTSEFEPLDRWLDSLEI